MNKIGLTGGIASGKTFIAKIFAELGCKIFDSDLQVFEILQKQEILEKIKQEFPETFVKGEFSKEILSKLVFSDKKKLSKLEGLIYPEIEKRREIFLQNVGISENIIFDSPKLIESGLFLNCDWVVLVISPEEEKIKRALARKGMDLEKFNLIKANQMTDSERMKYADFVINGAASKEEIREEAIKILEKMRS